MKETEREQNYGPAMEGEVALLQTEFSSSTAQTPEVSASSDSGCPLPVPMFLGRREKIDALKPLPCPFTEDDFRLLFSKLDEVEALETQFGEGCAQAQALLAKVNSQIERRAARRLRL